jgi:hypothetical protein
MARRGRHGEAGRGAAWHGGARQGAAGRGEAGAAVNLKKLAASYAVTACGEESAGHSITVTKLASAKQEVKSYDFA